MDYVYKRIPHRIVAVRCEELFHEVAVDNIKRKHPQVNKVVVELDEKGIPSIYNKLHDSWIKCKMDDMVRIDLADEGDVYPIDIGKFDELYESVEDYE